MKEATGAAAGDVQESWMTFSTDLKKAGKGLPGLVTEAETTVSDVDKTAKAAQKSWLLRRNVPQPKEHTIRMDADPGKD